MKNYTQRRSSLLKSPILRFKKAANVNQRRCKPQNSEKIMLLVKSVLDFEYSFC